MSSKNSDEYVSVNTVMNDDVLKLILSHLTVKEKIKIERVSKQFKSCVRQLLLNQNGLQISHQNIEFCADNNHYTSDGNINELIVVRHRSKGCLRYRTLDVSSSLNAFNPLLEKCLNIKALDLIECDINYETVDWIWNKCTKIECLKILLDRKWSDSECDRIGVRIGPTLKHLYIQSNDMKVNRLLKNLKPINELVISCYRESINELDLKLLNSLRKFSYIHSFIDENTAEVLSELKNLTHLKITDIYDSSIARNIFKIICLNMNHIIYLSFCSDSKLLYSDLSQLNSVKNIKILEISLASDFNSPKLNQINSLKSLKLMNTALFPKSFEFLIKTFPNLKKIELNLVLFDCECDPKNINCDNCESKYIKIIKSSKIRKLKYDILTKIISKLDFLKIIDSD